MPVRITRSLIRYYLVVGSLRSAYLSLLNGLCFMASLVATVVRQLPGSFLQLEVNVYAVFTVGGNNSYLLATDIDDEK